MITTMTDKARNDFATYGLEILKRSVLLVLYEADQLLPGRGKTVSMKEIRKRLDLPQLKRSEISVGNPTDLVRAILQHLYKDGLVDHTVRGGWEITPEGIEFIDG